MSPQIHLRSCPPEGGAASLVAARQEANTCPRIHLRSWPPEGVPASFEAARQEAV